MEEVMKWLRRQRGQGLRGSASGVLGDLQDSVQEQGLGWRKAEMAAQRQGVLSSGSLTGQDSGSGDFILSRGTFSPKIQEFSKSCL